MTPDLATAEILSADEERPKVQEPTTAAALLVDEELRDLQRNGELLGWDVWKIDDLRFVLGLVAREGSRFYVWCNCEQYGAIPPAWHWYNPATDELDQRKDTPKGGTFFHSAGVICAPWNRLAYVSVDPRGPHGDWALASWKANPQTGACKTLSAMALRVHIELTAPTFDGRMA